ncbi:MAG: Hsp20/alpha crystallin family protein [Spirochaetia bacterium]|nr:Hsp20/alpha crystallin family protein [Spirochaetia bacterium]
MTDIMTMRPMHKAATPFWDTFFDDFFAPAETAKTKSRVPLTDITETPSEYIFETEFPGFTQEELEVKMDKNRLTLKAEKKTSAEQTENKAHYIMSERQESYFRSFSMPEDIDAEKIKATFENGLLRLEVPKKEKELPRTIKIN